MRAAQEILKSHCPFGLYALELHLVDHLIGSLERFRSVFALNKELLEQFYVSIKKLNRVWS